MTNETNNQKIDSTLTAEQETQLNLIFDKFEEKFLTILNIEKLEKNSIIFIRADPANIDFIMALPLLASKYKERFQDKNIAVVICGPDDRIEVLDEKKMNALGWEKKEKSLIIQPGQF